MLANFYRNKKIFITGHTGFKGAWLCILLKKLEAKVFGFSLEPPSTPSLYELASVSEGILSTHADIRDLEKLKRSIETFQPDIIIHMAAQSLVRKSYQDPVGTYSSNVMGSVHLLDAVRQVGNCRAVINVTSDKCYANQNWIWGYREYDSMGGNDPYSSSKGCSELVTNAYTLSFFHPDKFDEHGTTVASVRAGNVIGGGDFAQDRLIPDIIRAIQKNEPIHIRYPKAIRPWQHVLDCLLGYLTLAKKMSEYGPRFSGSWNFGPSDENVKEVGWVVDNFYKLWDLQPNWTEDHKVNPREEAFLKLDCTKARTRLGWKSAFNIHQTLKWTADWYSMYHANPSNVLTFTEKQVKEFIVL